MARNEHSSHDTASDAHRPAVARTAVAIDPTRLAEPMGSAVVRSLQRPLEALRACLEALALELPASDHCGAIATSAEEEVERLIHTARSLALFLQPEPPQPLRCSVEEILHAARRALRPELRDRTWVALEPNAAALVTDGPMLARALARLIENGHEAGSECVLVRARGVQGALEFAVLDQATRPLPLDLETCCEPFRSSHVSRQVAGQAIEPEDQLGLGLTLAARDIALLQGSLSLEQNELGDTCFRVRLPSSTPGGAAS